MNEIEVLGIRLEGETPVVNTVALANYFRKRHRDVLRDVENVCAKVRERSAEWFRPVLTARPVPKGGTRQDRSFDVTEEGYIILVMGWTGEEAMKRKVAYIDAFNSMRKTLQTRGDPLEVLKDPAKALELIGSYASRLQIATAAKEEAIMQRDELAAAHERFASHDGTVSITVAAKTIDVPPKKLFAWLEANQWIYRPGGRGEYVGRQTKIQQGLLVMTFHEVRNSHGEVVEVARARVTTKGIDKLSVALHRPKAPATEPLEDTP
jgi:anti-repressor protein